MALLVWPRGDTDFGAEISKKHSTYIKICILILFCFFAGGWGGGGFPYCCGYRFIGGLEYRDYFRVAPYDNYGRIGPKRLF